MKRRWIVKAKFKTSPDRIVGRYWLRGNAEARAERARQFFRRVGWNTWQDGGIYAFAPVYVVERLDD